MFDKGPVPGRNDACWCGSGKKYKKCHSAFDERLERLWEEGWEVLPRTLYKTPADIEGIKRSAAINVGVLDYVGEHIAAGMTTNQIDQMIYDYTVEHGGTPADLNYEGYPKSVCTSINDVVCHGIPCDTDVLHEGDIISIDGTQGIVVDGAVDLVSAELTGDLDTILSWADEIRLDETCGHANHVRVNADNPEDAELALEFGAEAIGLCRTEHMFLGDRKNIIQSFILSDDEAVKQQALADLLKVQTEDFLAMFKTMSGRDVVVRLLDPPLHEFLDDPRELEVAITKKEAAAAPEEELTALRARLRRIDGMVESNPMLGLRGVRLSVVFGDLPLMQVRAVATAAARLIKEGVDPRPEIMVPLVSITAEHVQTREVIERVIAEVSAEEGVELDIPVGTMLELPRACMVADEIAQHADFFCFGTNDLTQTTFGFSRDDAEAKFIPLYMHKKILKDNPFETIDSAVLELVRMAVEKGRATNPDMHFGVCGEHGGDPKSIKGLFNVADVDYVSCSPYRVPLARLAAAQAKLEAKRNA